MVTDLRLQHFRSYKDDSFEFDDGVNIIVGPNASGKTNLLEAILVSCIGSSYRGPDSDLIAFRAAWARLDAHTAKQTRVVKLTVGADEKTAKQFEIDGHKLSRLTLVRSLPVVLFDPNHLQLLQGSPELRRNFLDDLLEQTIEGYGALRRHYRRVLAQRNRLLKNMHFQKGRPSHLDAMQGSNENRASRTNGYGERGSQEADTAMRQEPASMTGSAGQQGKALRGSDQLFAWNIRLSELGGRLASERVQLIDRFNKDLGKRYSRLANKHHRATLRYDSSCDPAHYSSQLLRRLEHGVETDLARGFTTHGPHRDDMTVLLNNKPAGASASRGETRTLLLALKLLELDLIEDSRQQPAILLLDDVFSELDGARRRALTDALQGHQSFITTTDADVVVQHFMGDCHIIPVAED